MAKPTYIINMLYMKRCKHADDEIEEHAHGRKNYSRLTSDVAPWVS